MPAMSSRSALGFLQGKDPKPEWRRQRNELLLYTLLGREHSKRKSQAFGSGARGAPLLHMRVPDAKKLLLDLFRRRPH